MYRPKGWEKEHPHPCTNCDDNDKYVPWDCREGYCRDQCTQEDEYDTYEAGADAMLEAINGELATYQIEFREEGIWNWLKEITT